MKNTKTLLALLLLAACAKDPVTRTGECDSDNAGLKLQEGFCARVFADTVGVARHIVVAPNGDVYVAMENGGNSSAMTTHLKRSEGGIAALRDTTGDGRADVVVRIATQDGGSGIALAGDTLYFSTPSTVYRYRVDSTRFGQLFDEAIVVSGMPTGGHSSRSLALGDSGALFVSIGSDTDVCNGHDPCGEASERAAIWRFNAHATNQRMENGVRWAKGIRNAVGLTWNPTLRSLFATQHGRDGLKSDDLPSEEFMRVAKDSDFGWPYCYHDWQINRKVIAPEYGGNGIELGRCMGATPALMGFPGHWGPNGLIFYDGKMFPERYRGGAFIAFHGSWARRRQEGYKIVYVPFGGAMPAGDYEVFADGFAGKRVTPSGAKHRPVGMAVAPDGSLYVTDDQNGRIFNIRTIR